MGGHATVGEAHTGPMSIAEPSPADLANVASDAADAYDEAVERNRAAIAAGSNLPIGQGALNVLKKRAAAAAAATDESA